MRDGYARDVARQAANVVGAVFQILAAALAGPAIGRVAAEYETFVTPAGYAFAGPRSSRSRSSTPYTRRSPRDGRTRSCGG